MYYNSITLLWLLYLLTDSAAFDWNNSNIFSQQVIFFFRYNIQNNHETENAVLHCQLDNPVRWDHVFNCSRLLSALRFRREGDTLRLDPALTHRVFPAARWDYSADFPRSAIIGQIPTLHDDISHFLNMGDGLCS